MNIVSVIIRVGVGKRWITGDLELPFGRGVNFQWEMQDSEGIYQRVKALKPESIYLELESKSYLCGDKTIEQDQFIVQDPNGYLFRFCKEV